MSLTLIVLVVFKVLQQNGCEQGKQRNIAHDHQCEEVTHADPVADIVGLVRVIFVGVRSRPLVHGPVPILTHDDNEDACSDE